MQYLSFFCRQFLIILQPASLPEVLLTILLNYVPLVIFLLPILWTATYSHFVGISRKSFSIHYQQKQILIQFFHLGYILTTNFCWLCLAIKFKHGSGVTLIKLLMKQNLAQVACARLLLAGLLKPSTALHKLCYISGWVAHYHYILVPRLPKHIYLAVLTQCSTLTITE